MWEIVEEDSTAGKRVALFAVGNWIGRGHRRKGSGGLMRNRYIGSAFEFSRGKSGIPKSRKVEGTGCMYGGRN